MISLRLLAPIFCCWALMMTASTPIATAADVPVQHSELWGERGELWRPGGRLPDFSYAGYRRGEAPLPRVDVATNIRDHGAVGDGEADDTEALRRAIAATERGAVFLPAGRYRITEIVEIRKPGVVLRGAGPEQTVLFCPRPLQEIKPNMAATTEGRPTSNYSWSGGIVWVTGDFGSKELAAVIEPAALGATSLTLSPGAKLRVGQEVEVRQQDDAENSLAAHLYADQPGDTSNLNGRARPTLVARVAAIDGDRVTLDRPLPFAIEARWKPQVVTFEPTVTEVGIEDLGFEFPVLPYEGHFTEQGYNPIAFTRVAHCWVRNVAITHCDSGPFASSRFCTFEDIVFHSSRPADDRGNVGHHGVSFTGTDNLLQRFRFNVKFVHDISLESWASGNVIASGSGVDLCFDHHRKAPYANLFTDIDLGAGTRPWASGGGRGLGKHTAARATFWNLRAQRPQAWPPEAFGPELMNVVGLPSAQPPVKDPDGRWFEPVSPTSSTGLAPANLYEAQRERRLGSR